MNPFKRPATQRTMLLLIVGLALPLLFTASAPADPMAPSNIRLDDTAIDDVTTPEDRTTDEQGIEDPEIESQAAQSQPPEGLVVRDLVILLARIDDPILNGPEVFRTRLPARWLSARPRLLAEDTEQSGPIGLMTFAGDLPDGPIQVTIRRAAEDALAAGPATIRGSAESHDKSVTQFEFTLSDTPALNLPPDWLGPISLASDRLAVTASPIPERALIYDFPMGPRPLMACAGQDGTYRVHHGDDFRYDHLSAYRRVDPASDTAGWTRGILSVDEVGQDPKNQRSSRVEVVPASGDASASDRVSQERSTSVIANLLATDAVGTLQFEDQTFATAGDALSNWSERLADAGMGAAEIEVALDVLNDVALAHDKLAVVYQLPEAELERLLPLEIKPEPTTVHRVGLVILLGQDPELENQVRDLITQLGSDQWSEREFAQRSLIEIGPEIRRQVTQALEHEDLEIRARAEQILRLVPESIRVENGNRR